MAVIKCPECGHQTSEKATVCPSCGVEIAGKIVKCANCGEVFFKEDGLCPHCYRPYQFHESVADEAPEELPSPIADTAETETDNASVDDDNPTPPTTKSPAKDQHVYTAPTIAVLAMPSEEEEDEETFKDPEETESKTDEEEQNKDLPADDNTDQDNKSDDDDDDVKFIDTDAEQLERPTKETSDDEDADHKSPKRYIAFIVSIAITALIAAVCLYFYNDSKSIKELQAFNSAMENGDVDQLNTFLRDFTDATVEHKQKVKDEIARLNKQEQDLSLVRVTRDKAQLLQYLKDYPDTPMKKDILATIDSLDWEDAYKTNTKAAYDKYIAEHANGIFIKDAKDKVAVKEVAATEEDSNMARSLFREFFLSVNGNDASRLTNTLSGEISSFMGTEKPGSGEIVSWMKRQHGENVSSVIWKLNHDYKINKREQNGAQNYNISFTAKQTIVHKDGRASSENFKITSDVTDKCKIASMSMTKYTPQPGENSSTTTSSSKPASSSSSSSSKPAASSKPASSSSSSSSKPAASSKPASSSSSSSSKPAASSKPTSSSSSSSSKPAASSKPASSSSSSSSKPAASSKPASSSSSSSSKPAASSKSASSSSSSSSKPAASSKPASSGSSSAKPNNQSNKK